MEEIVTAKVVCDKLSISKRTLCKWKNEGLPSIKLSYNIVRYDLISVMEWVKERNKEQKGAETEN
ncbi:helix-turn-helix transcriptional regulator [Paenibacillus sp. YIM B09110]|uniref:helix-turn-helix transcriptional regulator n=1 Tax=Paenibacillus sp. YIM B09110 TaxID=3126102 RepID=UPI00301C7816